MNNDTKLTSVKIIKELYNSFKKSNIENNFTLQKLVNRSIFLYNKDSGYRKKIFTTQSGSGYLL